MKKNAKLPIPKPNYFIDKGDFGDDAGFYSENVYGDAIGIHFFISSHKLTFFNFPCLNPYR